MENKRTFGILLVVFGALYLLGQIMDGGYFFGFRLWRSLQLWPMLIVSLGLIFDYFYYTTKKNPGFLVPGGFLITLGMLHLFETLTMWRFAAYTWPIYTLAIFVGFFHLYIVTKTTWSLVVSIIFFSLFALMEVLVFMIFFGAYISFGTLMAGILIVVGILLLTGKNIHLGNQG